MFLSVIKIVFLFVFKTRDSSGSGELVREAHSMSMKGLELYSRSFLRFRKFWKKFEFDHLCNVATLDTNVATLPHRDIERSKKHKPLSRPDVGFQRRDVGRPHFRALSVTSRCWPQRRDVRF